MLNLMQFNTFSSVFSIYRASMISLSQPLKVKQEGNEEQARWASVRSSRRIAGFVVLKIFLIQLYMFDVQDINTEACDKQQIILICYMSESEFETVCRLGEGSYGQVYRVKRRSDGREYALKKVKLMNMKEKDKRNTLSQVRILASVDHPNIIQYREAIFDENKGELALIMELAHGGDLADKIKTRFNRGQTFREQQIWKWGAEILEGLQCLHRMGVIHRDIKPANIMFSKDGTPLLGDLNVARELTQGLAQSQTGTPNYAAPEIWDNLSYGAQCDIWSFGCIIYELCCFRSPFRSRNMDQLYKKVKLGKFDPIPRRYSINLQLAIEKCLKKRESRISLDQLIKLFAKRAGTTTLKRSHSVGTLIKNIKMPNNTKDVSSLLPSARYVKKELKLNPEQQEKKQVVENVLDRFLKQKRPAILNRQRRLNNKVYVEESSLKPCKSEVIIADKEKNTSKRIEEENKLQSFKQILDSIQGARVSTKLAKMGMRKRNQMYGLRLFD